MWMVEGLVRLCQRSLYEQDGVLVRACKVDEVMISRVRV